MLQIASGKLFTRDIYRTNRLRGVLFSNARFSYDARSIETAAGTLVTTTPDRGVHATVFEMDEHIELHPSGTNILLSHTLRPFLEDFAIVASFGFDLIISPDRDLVRDLTLVRPTGHGPARFKSRTFSSEVFVSEEEIEAFQAFCDKLMGLERCRFLEVMDAMRTYVSALHRLADNPSMAYALLVSAVESLAQAFDAFEPVWTDVSAAKRGAVDGALEAVDQDTATSVRSAILANEHAALACRYRAFVIRHINRAYFRSAGPNTRPIARYELEQAVKHAYGFRSKYLHSLKRLPDDIREPYGDEESVTIERRPALTIQGLARLTRHTIMQFVQESEGVEHEPYDYLLETSGIRMMKLAAEYWVGRPMCAAGEGRKRLEGFLTQYAAVLDNSPGAALTDLRPMLSDVERLMPQARETDRPALLALHYLFNGVLPAEERTQNCEAFLKRWEVAADMPSAETFIARTLADDAEGWDAETFRKARDLYFENRARPSGFHAPRVFEAAALLALADRLRLEGAPDVAEAVALAVECYPENGQLIAFESTGSLQEPIDWRKILFAEEEIGGS